MTPSQPRDLPDESLRRLFLRIPALETSEDDPASFDAESFAVTLKRSHVEVVTFLASAFQCEPLRAGASAGIALEEAKEGNFLSRLVAACARQGVMTECAISDDQAVGTALASLPSRPALEAACYHQLCLGRLPALEDSIAPHGTFDVEAYRLLGIVLDEIASKERWWRGAQRLVEVGIVSPATPTESGAGAARIVQAGGVSYALLDPSADFTPYRVLILPEDIPCEGMLKARVQVYLQQGGCLLATFETDRAAEQSGYGVTGETRVIPGYGLVAPGVGQVTLLGEPHCRAYAQSAGTRHRQAVLEALKRLLPDPLLRHDGPGTLEAIVTEQTEHNRWVLHLMHYLPIGFALDSPVRDELLPVHEVKFSLKTPKPVARVALRPQHHDALDFWEHQGRVEFVVPKITGHRMVSIEFAS